MDEIFDRIKSLKIKHKFLASGLIVTELIGITVLIWYLGMPFLSKFFINPTRSYAIESFDPRKRYLIQQGDLLRGRNALPNSKILAIITPGEYRVTSRADNKGQFTVQLPQDAKLGRHRVTFVNYDALKNLAWVKSYKLTVNSNSKIQNSPLIKKLTSN